MACRTIGPPSVTCPVADARLPGHEDQGPVHDGSHRSDRTCALGAWPREGDRQCVAASSGAQRASAHVHPDSAPGTGLAPMECPHSAVDAAEVIAAAGPGRQSDHWRNNAMAAATAVPHALAPATGKCPARTDDLSHRPRAPTSRAARITDECPGTAVLECNQESVSTAIPAGKLPLSLPARQNAQRVAPISERLVGGGSRHSMLEPASKRAKVCCAPSNRACAPASQHTH